MIKHSKKLELSADHRSLEAYRVSWWPPVGPVNISTILNRVRLLSGYRVFKPRCFGLSVPCQQGHKPLELVNTIKPSDSLNLYLDELQDKLVLSSSSVLQPSGYTVFGLFYLENLFHIASLSAILSHSRRPK
ncbi:hypothetical protein TWF694_010588 [Orbilia ellipsospora]|uniref:Uncharacterized protein n=1 Tax=Orbilia ellipsospora TaxID=2528407 RepID=A0AAV9XAP0_9PEZI